MAKSTLHALESLTAPQPHYGLPSPAALNAVNHSIKMAASWQDIQVLMGTATSAAVTVSNASYALFRLGCMSCLAAPQKQAQIRNSGLIQHLFTLAYDKVADCNPHELTHIVDACARLRYRPPHYILQAVAAQAHSIAGSFTAHQLPLLLWGFATVQYQPEAVVQRVLDQAVQSKADGLSPQGVSLTLWAYKSLQHRPAETTLEQLCQNWTKHVQEFKPHELANCLESCSALEFHPGQTVLDAIAARMGQSAAANSSQSHQSLSGKPSLTPNAKRITVLSSPSARRLSGLIKAAPSTRNGSASLSPS